MSPNLTEYGTRTRARQNKQRANHQTTRNTRQPANSPPTQTGASPTKARPRRPATLKHAPALLRLPTHRARATGHTPLLHTHTSDLLCQRHVSYWTRARALKRRVKTATKETKLLAKQLAMTSPTRSKRQRLFDLVKTTKDVYIPTISNTISQLANEATTRALNYTEGDSAREVVINTDTKGAQILLYPHFTRHNTESGAYYTQVHGWVFSAEGSTRKKKLIFTLARQLAKSNNNAVSSITADQLDEQLSTIQDTDDASTISSASSEPLSGGSVRGSLRPLRRSGTASSESSTISVQSETDEVLKERIANFVNRSLGNTELTIAVGGDGPEELVTVDLLTDANGNFNVDIETPYKPRYVQVAISNDAKVFQYRDTIFPGTSPYAIISDIDDTIKRTGVCGDKRTIFRNVFTESMETWEIPGAADCYRFLNQKYGMPFFYVSNSPYQLYSNLVKFFDMFEFPQGSMYLKKYTGNILNSFFEPSHTRKKAPLDRILAHFGDKRFFLVGDSSEQDLEAYTDMARSHPDKVAGIYIRLAENSMKIETYKMLVDLLNKRSIPLDETTQEIQEKLEQLKTSEQNLIDLDDDPTPGISKDHMVKLVEDSLKKSENVDKGVEDLEQGSTDAFFASPHTSSSPDTHPTTPRRPVPPKPSKPRALQSNPTTAPKSAPPEISSSSRSAPLPPLPRRPVPPPPPPRSITRPRDLETQPTSPTQELPPSFSSNTLNDEESEEWISRILTSSLILRKSGNIPLKLFVDFDDVQMDIMNYIKAHEK